MASKQYRKFNANVREEIQQYVLALHDKKIAKLREARPWMTASRWGNEAPTKQAAELGDAIYKEMYTAAERERMNKLPEGWLPEVLSTRVHIKSLRNEGHDSVVISFTKPHRIWYAHYDNRKRPTIDGPKSRILAEDQKLLETWTIERSELQNKTWQLLTQVRTVEQLFERWPEALKIMPEGYFRPEPPGTAIVIQSQELNTILGL